MGLILDTSAIIAGERRSRTVREILEQIEECYGNTDIGISVVTIAELTHGAYRAKPEGRKLARLAFIERLCSDVPIYPFTVQIARMVGRIEAEQQSHGSILGFEDLVIGATAMQLGFEVATVNLRHFQRIPGLTVIGL